LFVSLVHPRGPLENLNLICRSIIQLIYSFNVQLVALEMFIPTVLTSIYCLNVLWCSHAVSNTLDEDNFERGIETIQIGPDSDPGILAAEICRYKSYWCGVITKSAIELRMNKLYGYPLINWKWSETCRHVFSVFPPA